MDSILFRSAKNLARECLPLIPIPARVGELSINKGSALFAIYLSEVESILDLDPQSLVVTSHLSQGLELLKKQELNTSLFQNLPGYAWALSVLHKKYFIDWADDVLEEIDLSLLEAIDEAGDDLSMDIINGASGILIYIMTRPKNKVNEILNFLSRWFIKRFPQWSVEKTNQHVQRKGDRNLGLAHGIPGVLSTFAIASKRNLLPQDINNVLKKGFDQLWSTSHSLDDGGSIFPFFENEAAPPRLSWCYGSLGVAVSFLHGAHLSSENLARANKVVATCVALYGNPSKSLTRDASICHGRAGVALLFSRLASANGLSKENRDSCAEVANDAAEHVFKMWEDSSHLPLLRPPHDGRGARNLSLLEGSLGMAMACLSIVTGGPSAWHDLFAIGGLSTS